MQRTKLVFAFASTLLVLAVTAIPAAAWFEGTNGTSGLAKSSGASVLTQAKGNTVTCSKAEGPWKIRSTGKVTEQTKGPGQQPTKQGPHQDLYISKWEGCFASGAAGTAPATVEPCELQLEQPLKGGTVGTGSVASECRVKVVLGVTSKGTLVECEIKVAPTSNEKLATVNYSKTGASVSEIANITGLTNTIAEKESGCLAVGTVAEAGNKFKGTTVAGEMKLV
jgi:hypothetical protein